MSKLEKESSKNSNIAQQIFEDLERQILGGQLSAGERLLGERELAAKYGTNRNTLREAVRKLEQARLVSVRHGRGVTVADFRRTGTPELLAPYLRAGPDMVEVAEIIGDVLEPRILLLEYASRLAVRRAEPADIERLKDIGDLLIKAFEAGDVPVVARGFQRWLDVLVEAGHSVSVRWIANSLFDALRDTLERFPNLWVLEPSFPEYVTGLVNAVRSGDEASAVTTTRSYYERVDQKLMALLHALAGVTPGTIPPEAAEGMEAAEHRENGESQHEHDGQRAKPEVHARDNHQTN
ncbi:MAG TPA: GntR family transcriptional regulator [Polyangiaceae bacterium]|nr:GntR family transcriptional regulator [Polyangiaceae bacterium]